MKVLTKCVALSAVGLLALSSCSDENPWLSGDGRTGRINPLVVTDTKVTDAVPTRATQELQAPDVNDFSLKLSKVDGSYEKSWDRLSMFPADQAFPIGDYTMQAWYGSVDEEGLNRPCYFGTTQFNVAPDATTTASVTASLANTMVSVDYTDAFKKYFATYSVTLHSEGHGYNTLLSSDTEPMFLAPGQVTVSLTFTKTDGTGATIEPAEFQADARHHYHITMDVNGGNVGSATLSITFDDSVVEEDVEIDLSDELIRSAAPEVMADGFTSGDVINLLEGTRYDNPLKFTVFAGANMKEARLTVESASYNLPLGNNNEVNLMELGAAEQSVASSIGIRCIGLYKNPDKMALVDLTEFAAQLPTGTHKMILVAKDKLTRISEPVEVTVNIDPVELSFVGQPGALYGATTAKFTMNYNGTDFAEKVSFKVKQENGQFVDAPVTVRAAKPARHAATRSEAFPTKEYEVTITIPRCVFNMPMEVYYRGTKMLTETLNVVVPDYDVQTAGFATKAYIKIVPEEASHLATITENARVFANGTEVKGSNIERDAETGIICIKGLDPSTQYTLGTTCVGGSNPSMATTSTVTTEAKTLIENGDFSQTHETINIGSIKVGGKFRVSPVDYQITSSIVVSEPTGWASLNSLTCYEGSSNKNTWYLVPSTYMEDGAVVLRSVAYDHNGSDIARSGGAFNTTYYCENTPSSIASRAAGELFLGSYTYNGSATRVDGIQFLSRPSSLVIECDSYEPYGSDHAVATVTVKSLDNSVIASGSKNITGAGRIEIPLTYAIFGSKAAFLEVSVKSSASDAPETAMPSSLKEDGINAVNFTSSSARTIAANQYHALSVGSVLKISSVQVKY